jgi:hypothetical protein
LNREKRPPGPGFDTGGGEEMGMAEIDQRTFQDTVDEYLIRHRSILDVQSKLSEAAARINRAIAKSVTTCGCITIQAGRQRFPAELSISEVRHLMKVPPRWDTLRPLPHVAPTRSP